MSMENSLNLMNAKKAYENGEWDMFCLITSVDWGKQCYFEQDNGVVFSGRSGKYLRDREEAYKEYLDAISVY